VTTETRASVGDGPPVRGMDVVCSGLSFDYDQGGSPIRALDGVDLHFAAGSATALLGPTGSGKSTLLQAIRGLIEPRSGSVTIDGAGSADAGFAERLREVGIVFQTPEMQLFAASARDDVAFGPRRLGWSADQVEAAVTEALDVVGLPADRYGGPHPHSLSGGEQRRLALAGVLAMRPRLLLLDEPFVSLDPAARRDLSAVLASLHAAGMGLVLATHDVDVAWRLCDRRIVLDGGRVASSGTWSFDAGGTGVLTAHRLRPPLLVELWQRLDRPLHDPPRTAAEAVEALA
jgi:energy-coupling factor transporter ATP-binding protein EcfA2